MSSSSLLQSEFFFENSQFVQVRPGRTLRLLHLPNPSSKVTIFFVHGSCAKMEQFEGLIRIFQPKFSIVAYDAYGCGGSPKPEHEFKGYSPNAHSSDLLSIFNRYAGDINIGIGHSFGSCLIMRLASQFTTKNIEGLVLIGTGLHMPDGGHPIFKLPIRLLECLKPVLSWRFRKLAFHPSTAESIKQKSAVDNPMHVVKAFYTQFSWLKRETISNLIIPVLIIQGEDDKITLLENARALAKTLSNSEIVVVADASHQVMEEQSVSVAEHVHNFIEGKVLKGLDKHGILSLIDERNKDTDIEKERNNDSLENTSFL